MPVDPAILRALLRIGGHASTSKYALGEAAKRDDVVMAEMLLDEQLGARENFACYNAAVLAVTRDHVLVLGAIKRRSQFTDNDMYRLLMLASRFGQLGAAAYIVEPAHGLTSYQLCQALCFAAEEGHSNEVIALLISSGADVNFHSGVALCQAVIRGHAETVQLLLSYGVDQECHGSFPLRVAVYGRMYDMADILLSRGARAESAIALAQDDPRMLELLMAFKERQLFHGIRCIDRVDHREDSWFSLV